MCSMTTPKQIGVFYNGQIKRWKEQFQRFINFEQLISIFQLMAGTCGYLPDIKYYDLWIFCKFIWNDCYYVVQCILH